MFERAARHRHLEVEKHAASSVQLSVGGVRGEGVALRGYVAMTIPSSATGPDFHTDELDDHDVEASDEECLNMYVPVMSKDILSAAAIAAKIIVGKTVPQTQAISDTQPPGNQSVLELPQVRSPSYVNQGDDRSWSSELDLAMEPEVRTDVEIRQEGAEKGEKFIEFSREDENKLIALASEQAPAWRLQKNVQAWMKVFPGRDPAVVQRRYDFLLRGWGAFKNINDLVLCRDGRTISGHRFSSSTQQALARYHA